MNNKIMVKEVSIEEVVRVNAFVKEFGEPYSKKYFESRYDDKKHLNIVAYLDDDPAGYIVAHDEYGGQFLLLLDGRGKSSIQKERCA